jgi:hypothetical protein
VDILLINGLLFFVPGYVIATALKVSEKVFLWSLFASYTFLLIHLLGSQMLHLMPTAVWTAYLVEVSLIILIVLVVKARRRGLRFLLEWPRCGKQLISTKKFTSLKIIFSLAFFGILIAWKPYTEIPADFWQHLEYIRSARDAIEAGQGVPNFNLWYVAQGWIWHLSQAPVESYILWTGVFNSLVFSAGCFVVAKGIFEFLETDSESLEIGSAIAAVAMLLMFGVGVFAYFRYYTFAPGFFAYILYLFSFNCLFILTQKGYSPVNRVSSTLVLPILGFVVYLVHRQEALFIALMVSATALYLLIDATLRNLSVPVGGPTLETECGGEQGSRTGVRLGLMVIVVILVTATSLMLIDYKSAPVTHRDILDLGSISRNFEGLKILKIPSQVTDVFGILGVSVLIATFVVYRIGEIPVVLVLSVFVVIVTVFNPLFVHIFLKFSEQEVLWRMGYMTPWPLMFGLLFFKAKKSPGPKKTIALIAVLSPIIASITLAAMDQKRWPNWLDVTFKTPTLQVVSETNSYQMINDLIWVLNEQVQTNRHILTDPVTGYILASTTNHSHKRWKFHTVDFIEFNLPGYSDRSFEDYKGWLLVLNLREGALSRTGEVSGHWPETILRFHDYYSLEFLKFVETYTEQEKDSPLSSSPPRFRKLWQSKNIFLYEIL